MYKFVIMHILNGGNNNYVFFINKKNQKYYAITKLAMKEIEEAARTNYKNDSHNFIEIRAFQVSQNDQTKEFEVINEVENLFFEDLEAVLARIMKI